ncbi:hypothetical protein J2W28_006460 [Variovorax boronicumulans]|uniref:DNA-binding protein n=1 Tax=Variovorax boronicumulans TaxID=436515 RepID=UPI002783A81A|nr:DNA-binding protein [Variovorax boronicumulans]MDP9995472.1 hypothetical protein [Variovorax boronicumulans]MDQ0007285.1 hypothetical protein [Variovorax boronicumulans]
MFNKPRGFYMATKTIQPVSLEHETRSALPTPEAAFHLNRAPQTLRLWACLENGPIRPIRMHGRLAWPTSEIRRLMGVPS